MAVHAGANTLETWFGIAEIGLRAARRGGDRAGEAEMLGSLGVPELQVHRLADAAVCHEGALALRRELGDRSGEAHTLNALGLVSFASVNWLRVRSTSRRRWPSSARSAPRPGGRPPR